MVCKESVDSARDSANRALDLADLALRIAELTPGDEAWRARVQGYAWAHVGNARRVKGDLPGADEAFVRASKLWQAGEESGTGLLAAARLLDLEASLRREQGRFQDALQLLDRALAADNGEHFQRILFKRATVFEALGDYASAVEALKRATPRVEATGEPRLLFILRFNMAVNLCFLESYEEADRLLPELKELARVLGNGLDFVRLRWLEGRIAAGLRKHCEALSAFTRVQEEFTAREIGFDAALVSLEMANLYLEEGRMAEVYALGQQLMWVFKSQGVNKEALAALGLFCQAVEQDAVTIELTRKLVRYLQRVRHDPNLRFNEFK